MQLSPEMTVANAGHPPSIALPEGRELDLFARILEGLGAKAIRCPFLAIVDHPDQAPVEAWLRTLISGGIDDVVFMTGEGVRRLVSAADRLGLRDEVVASLAKVRCLARGPKPVRALREVGISHGQAEVITVSPATTDGVIQALAPLTLLNRRVGIQLFGEDPGARLVAYVASVGGCVVPVSPYVYASASDDERIVELVAQLARGELDAIAFTSSTQVERLWKVAESRGVVDPLMAGLRATWIAAVGPVAAEALSARGINVDAMPDHAFFLRPLAIELMRLVSRGKKPTERDPR